LQDHEDSFILNTMRVKTRSAILWSYKLFFSIATKSSKSKLNFPSILKLKLESAKTYIEHVLLSVQKAIVSLKFDTELGKFL